MVHVEVPKSETVHTLSTSPLLVQTAVVVAAAVAAAAADGLLCCPLHLDTTGFLPRCHHHLLAHFDQGILNHFAVKEEDLPSAVIVDMVHI